MTTKPKAIPEEHRADIEMLMLEMIEDVTFEDLCCFTDFLDLALRAASEAAQEEIVAMRTLLSMRKFEWLEQRGIIRELHEALARKLHDREVD